MKPAFTWKIPDNINPKVLKELMNPTPFDTTFEVYQRRGYKYYFRNSQGNKFALRFDDPQPIKVGDRYTIIDHVHTLASSINKYEAKDGVVSIKISFDNP